MFPPRKIKLAQVITRMDRGGAPDIVRHVCARLDRRVFELCLVTGATLYPSRATEAFLRSFPGRVVVVDSLLRDVELLRDARAFLKLAAFFRKERFDVIHTHTAKAGALGRIAAVCSGSATLVHTPHGHNLYGYFNPAFSMFVGMAEKMLAGFTRAITVPTAFEKNDLMRYGIAGADKIAVIAQGVDVEDICSRRLNKDKARRLLALPSDVCVVGMAARLEPVKGAHDFLRAACSVVQAERGVYFVVAGDGSCRSAMEEAAARAGCAQNFRFLGWREDVPEIISACDLTVLASLNEAAGNSLIESQLLGCPVVATRAGGIPAVVRDNETGLLVQSGRPDELKRAMLTLIRDAGLRMRMGACAAAWSREQFSSARMAGSYADLYMDIARAMR